jgi:mRNA-degrading endonuclease toxin of MazEF toxin-antitoxin module
VIPRRGVASLDNVLTLPKTMLVRRVGALALKRRLESFGALRAAIDR